MASLPRTAPFSYPGALCALPSSFPFLDSAPCGIHGALPVYFLSPALEWELPEDSDSLESPSACLAEHGAHCRRCPSGICRVSKCHGAGWPGAPAVRRALLLVLHVHLFVSSPSQLCQVGLLLSRRTGGATAIRRVCSWPRSHLSF